MSIDEMIARALNEELEEELRRFEQMPDHTFSRKFERKMKKLIAAVRKGSAVPVGRITPRKARLFALIILLSILAFTGAAFIIVYVFGNFKVEQHDIYSTLRIIDPENCPETLEERYELVIDTTGYETYIIGDLPDEYWVEYRDKENGKYISYEQAVKRNFQGARLNTEDALAGPDEIMINGKYRGVYFETYYGEKCAIWDNGEYIFFLSCTNFSKDELIEMTGFVKKIE